MFTSWLFSCACLELLRLTFQPMLQVELLALWSGSMAIGTYVVFAAPAAAIPPRRLQLRYPYIFVFCSLLWSTLLFRVFFRERPWTDLREPLVAGFCPVWIGGFTVCSVGIDLVLLARSAHTCGSRMPFVCQKNSS